MALYADAGQATVPVAASPATGIPYPWVLGGAVMGVVFSQMKTGGPSRSQATWYPLIGGIIGYFLGNRL